MLFFCLYDTLITSLSLGLKQNQKHPAVMILYLEFGLEFKGVFCLLSINLRWAQVLLLHPSVLYILAWSSKCVWNVTESCPHWCTSVFHSAAHPAAGRRHTGSSSSSSSSGNVYSKHVLRYLQHPRFLYNTVPDEEQVAALTVHQSKHLHLVQNINTEDIHTSCLPQLFCMRRHQFLLQLSYSLLLNQDVYGAEVAGLLAAWASLPLD